MKDIILMLPSRKFLEETTGDTIIIFYLLFI